MITHDKIITIKLTPEQIKLAEHHTKKACIGGISRIYQGTDRQKNLNIDNYVGQLANLALSLYIYGNTDAYERAREIANENPYSGDGGSDLPGLNIDIKGSLIRNPNKDLLSYCLPVRPRERHKDTAYILALIKDENVNLIGWTPENKLPAGVCSSGTFKGAYIKPATELLPLPPHHKIKGRI
jgi:hypothetical protein